MANLNNDFFLGFEMGEEEGDRANTPKPPSRKSDVIDVQRVIDVQ